VADGNTSLPDTVLGMVQARLDALGHEPKRVLRAASVFGEVFWTGGVRALVGTEPGVFDVADWLEELAAREVITRSRDTRIPNQVEYRFRHALVRDGAYEMLTQEDQVLAHRLAAGWLEAVGETDALVLAEHFVRGGELARAVRWFRRAADQALEGKDLNAVIVRAERAIDAGAAGGELGSLRLLQSIAAYWQSRYAEAARYGEAASDALTAGDPEWFRAVGSTIVASARLGDSGRVDRWLEGATRAEPGPGAEGEQLVCLCRGAFQLIFHARFDAADTILARIASLAPTSALERLDALTVAQIEHVRGVRAAHVGDVARFLGHLEGAVAAFERAGDTRNVLLERTTVGWCYAELGDFARAEALVRENMSICAKSAVQQAVTYAKVNLGFILVHRAGGLEEARRQLWDAIVECRAVGNRRLEGWARAHLAAALHAEGEHEASELEARIAIGLLAASPGLCAWAHASRARALVASGRAEEALGPAREAMAILQELGGLLQGESLPPLVLAEALHALGDESGAREAVADACARLRFRAARLSRPEWCSSFLTIPDNARTLELERS
jgi:tetratricopeptide (TPR) repeat protein